MVLHSLSPGSGQPLAQRLGGGGMLWHRGRVGAWDGMVQALCESDDLELRCKESASFGPFWGAGLSLHNNDFCRVPVSDVAKYAAVFPRGMQLCRLCCEVCSSTHDLQANAEGPPRCVHGGCTATVVGEVAAEAPALAHAPLCGVVLLGARPGILVPINSEVLGLGQDGRFGHRNTPVPGTQRGPKDIAARHLIPSGCRRQRLDARP